MTSAAVLFYGRRSARSSRTFDDLGFGSSTPPSPFPSSSADPSNSNCHARRHRHRNTGDFCRRHRHVSFDDPTSRSPIPGTEIHQQSCDGESSARDMCNRESVHGLSGRYQRNNRLPGSVLLAKERLVQRLRGVSISGIRDSRETLPSLPSNHLLVADADWETGVSREEPAELPPGVQQQYAPREPQRKPPRLSTEALSLLHHEVFLEQQNPVTHPMLKASIDCSICLESFVEGNKLINLPCGHRFHCTCLYPWLQTSGECPYCRSCIMLTSQLVKERNISQ